MIKLTRRKLKRGIYLNNHKANLLTTSPALTSITTSKISSKKTSSSNRTINIPQSILSNRIMRKQQLKTWRKQRLLLRYALSTRECPLDFLSFSILILMIKNYHLKELLFSITASLIAHLLVVQIEMAGDINLARWKMEDLLRIVTTRIS